MNALKNIEIKRDKTGHFILFHKPSNMPIESTGFREKKLAARAISLFEGDVYNWAGTTIDEIVSGLGILTQKAILRHRNNVIYTARACGGGV